MESMFSVLKTQWRETRLGSYFGIDAWAQECVTLYISHPNYETITVGKTGLMRTDEQSSWQFGATGEALRRSPEHWLNVAGRKAGKSMQQWDGNCEKEWSCSGSCPLQAVRCPFMEAWHVCCLSRSQAGIQALHLGLTRAPIFLRAVTVEKTVQHWASEICLLLIEGYSNLQAESPNFRLC